MRVLIKITLVSVFLIPLVSKAEIGAHTSGQRLDKTAISEDAAVARFLDGIDNVVNEVERDVLKVTVAHAQVGEAAVGGAGSSGLDNSEPEPYRKVSTAKSDRAPQSTHN